MGENMKSRIIVCGGRHYEDYEQLERSVDQVISEMNLDLTEVEIVSGHCAGADQLGERYAKEHGAKCSIFPAQWHLYGRSAGPIRNSKMVEYAAESEFPVVVAFLSLRTRGTRDTVKKAEKRGFRVITVEYC